MKRLFYLACLCIIMMQSAVVFAAGGGKAEESYTLLYDLGIISDKDTDYEEKLTFENLAKMSLAMSTGGKLDPKADALDIAVTSGFIKPDSDGDASSADTARAIMCAAGYKRTDVSDENYYLRLAVEKGLFGGVSIGDSDAVTVGEAAAVFVNALDMETMVTDSTGSRSSGKTVIEDLFGLHTADGIFYPGEADGYSSDTVIIDGVRYQALKSFENMTGRKVRAYINKDDEVVSVNGRRFKNEVYIISANDIEKIDGNTIYFINADGKTVSKKISASASEVYNGQLCTYNIGDLDIVNGFITLIQHQGNTECGAVVIKQYDMLLAGGVGNGVIYDGGSGASISVNNAGTDVSVFMDGEETTVSEIKKYDVLLLYRTKDKERLRIEIVRNTVSGKVSAISDNYIKIDRRTYLKTAYYKEYAKEISVGEEATLILDGAGLAVGFRQDETGENYGYFMGLYYDEAEDAYKMRLLNSDGQVEYRSLKGKLKVDGIQAVNTSETGQLADSLKTLVKCDTSGIKTIQKMNDYVYQLIIYALDSEGKIRYIDTALELEGENSNNELTLDAYVNADKRFKTGSMQFVDSFGLSADNTKIFYVPQSDNVFDEYGNIDSSQRNSVSMSDYTVITTGWMRNDQDDITASAYNVSGGGVADAVVVENKDVGKDVEFTDMAAGLFILCEILESINDDDEPCYILNGMLDGKEASYTITEEKFGRMEGKSGEEVYVEPQKGDIMQIKADSDNRILSYSTRYSGRDNVNYYAYIGNNIWTQFGNFTGYVYDKDDYGFCTVSDVNTLSDKRFIMNKGVNKVYIYDMETDTVTAGTLSDLVSYKEYEFGASRIYARAGYGVVHTVIVYVNEEE